jgi:hypothetical protein
VRALLLTVVAAAAGLAFAQAAPPSASDCLVLEDFAAATVGQFPAGWEARDEDGRRVYTVAEEGGRRFLRAVSRGVGVQAARQTPHWDLDTYPVLVWAWRPLQMPQGADERQSATNDSPLAVYMGVPHSRIRGPKAVKYVWSGVVPAGTRLSSNHGLTQVRVLRTGAAGGGGWIEERVNARDDWKAAFGERQTPRAGGIAVLTDADDTRSTAAGDYADFRACRG